MCVCGGVGGGVVGGLARVRIGIGANGLKERGGGGGKHFLHRFLFLLFFFRQIFLRPRLEYVRVINACFLQNNRCPLHS